MCHPVADALRLLKEQADNTPARQWFVVGGWTEFQFAEKRLPTLEEINKAAPDTQYSFYIYMPVRCSNRAALMYYGF